MRVGTEVEVTRVRVEVEVAGETPDGEKLAPITYVMTGLDWHHWGTDGSGEGAELPEPLADSIADSVAKGFRSWLKGRVK
jgi:hypothetical protein